MDLLLCFTFNYGEVVEEFNEEDDDILEITSLYQNLSVTSNKVDPLTLQLVPLFTTDYNMSGQVNMFNGRMVKWFHRCRLDPLNVMDVLLNVFVPGQDVLVSYRL